MGFVPALIGGISAVAGAGIQSHSADKGAEAQTKAAADALAFQKQQAAYDAAVAETNRKANYDQWVASQHRLQSVGDLLGQGPREIPAYVPLPGSVGTTLGPVPSTAPAAPTSAPGSIAALMTPPAVPTTTAPFNRTAAGFGAPAPLSIEDLLRQQAA